ncbi:helix-turn-helix transcriptional regulator [Massilia soli]|uniref:LuxR family transcriptional regulator n=1 Tax=Massilia soli TaxID=2792854 RepID=A0ABS7SU32_9BURK|nr:LuxR family transcriptional regulator [Massilia soli]MBZ2209454.1 LuxR family transcriptional regulator [Massilia soli]
MVEMGLLTQLLSCTDEAAWRDTLFTLARRQGFDQVVYGVVGSRQDKLESAFLQSNYSSSWRDRYDADRLHYVDPTVSHCLASSLPIVWEPETFNGARQRAFYEEACGHGIRSGITFPIHGPNGEFGVVSFASDALPDPREATQAIASLALIRDYAFESSLRFVRPQQQQDKPRLTRRELEVLKWVMVGKSSWEISKITNCSEATVNFHIGNVRQKFGVSTRQQALVKAIGMGILIPEDHHR